MYNLKASAEAKDFVFPYHDNEFDLVVLTSVFTHMMPNDVNNYLDQINRVLKRDGKCFATFFLLNEHIIHSIEKRDYFDFPYIYGNYRLLDKNVKEANIAYQEDYLYSDLFPKNKLNVETIHYGWWSGISSREESLNYQDIIVLSPQKSQILTHRKLGFARIYCTISFLIYDFAEEPISGYCIACPVSQLIQRSVPSPVLADNSINSS